MPIAVDSVGATLNLIPSFSEKAFDLLIPTSFAVLIAGIFRDVFNASRIVTGPKCFLSAFLTSCPVEYLNGESSI